MTRRGLVAELACRARDAAPARAACAALVAWLCAATTLPAAAQDSIPDWHVAQPERPSVATHAYVLAPGVVEVEAGLSALRPAGGAETDLPFVAKFGPAPRTQLEVQWGWTHRRGSPIVAPPGVTTEADGPIDVAFALKVRVLENAPVLANFSVQPALKLPSGSADTVAGTGTGTTDVGLLLISSRSYGRFSLDLNAGETWRSGAGTAAPRTATLLTVSGGADLGRGWAFGLELFDYPGTSGPAGASPQIGLTIGPTHALRKWVVIDAGVVVNVSGLPANSLYAGVTWNVGRIPGWPDEH